MLRLHNYKKAYGSVLVLQVDDLQLDPGVYWLKGENGTGKSTLLKSIAGLVPFEGEIEAVGISLRKQRREFTKNVSFAEAEPTYPAFLTGKELLQFYLQTKGGEEKQLKQAAEALAIEAYLSNKVGTYSSGMLKKLSLLLSFAGNPKLILLDEPFITLDLKAVQVLRDTITTSQQEISFLISSHQELALGVQHRILHINHKTIEQEAYVTSA